MTKTRWFTGVAFLTAATVVHGQQIQPTPVPSAGTSTPTDQSVAPNQPPAEGGIEDIVVTAERRSESAQRSALSIEVVTGPQLSAVVKPQDLTNVSPGIQVGTSGVQPQVYIRGVGDTTVNSRTQGAVAFNVDGIYYTRGTQFTPSLFDISRIEILKGPQGTLYGRNASGGAVNVITVRPVLDSVEGFVEGELGNFDLRRISGAVNLPVGKTLAVRVAGQIIDRDGYTSDG